MVGKAWAAVRRACEINAKLAEPPVALRDFACSALDMSLDCTQPSCVSSDAEGYATHHGEKCIVVEVAHLVHAYAAFFASLSEADVARANQKYEETLWYCEYIGP